MPAATMMKPDHAQSNGGRLVAIDGRTLPLRDSTIRVDADGGLARVTLEQRFVNPYDEPLRLTYQVPMPDDGAVSGYAFRLGDRNIVGRVEPRGVAREHYERALTEGRSAALLDEERGSLFTQSLGNVPPRAEIVCTLTIDQPLRWLDEGAWEWRFPTVVAPRFLGTAGRTPDAARVHVDVADGPTHATLAIALRIADALTGAPCSPSHALLARAAEGAQLVTLAAEHGVALDRDVVVRWPVARPQIGVDVRAVRPVGKPFAYGLVSIVAPTPEHQRAYVGRDLCLLLDTSGSMSGAPLDQARRVSAALVESLGEGDQLEMIEFGDSPRRWKRSSVAATPAHKADALAWLHALSASGGTDMTAGILEALSGLRPEAQRQVVLVTDGLIGFEQEVLAQIRARLPAHSRLHVVGVGDGVNRSLTRPAARAGGGTEVVLGIDEDPEPAAQRIVRRTSRPVLTDVTVEGSAVLERAPARSVDLFAGSPAMISVRLRAEGGELIVRGRLATGPFEERLRVAPSDGGATALAALFARERVADLELDLAAGGTSAAIDGEIERLGLDFQIATRLTSFVAVSDRVDVDPTAPTRSEVMPHALTHGMSAAGLGLRSVMSPAASHGRAQYQVMPSGIMAGGDDEFAGKSERDASRADDSLRRSRLETRSKAIGALPAPPATPPAPKRPAPAAQAPKKVSVLSKVSSFFRSARRLRGLLRALGGDRFAVELTLDMALDWEAPQTARLRLDDGRVLEVMIDAAQSTRAGSYTTGLQLRVVVTLAAPEAPHAGELELELPRATLVIELEEAT